jgi:hypothetical protein
VIVAANCECVTVNCMKAPRKTLRKSVVALVSALALIALAGCEGRAVNVESIPTARPGIEVPSTNPATYNSFASDIGIFRTSCSRSHYNWSDPIVYPGQPGKAHLHMFFGNTSTNANTTNPGGTGGSTCDGGTLNRTAYWVPALLTDSGNVVDSPGWEDDMQVYYKAGYDGVRSQDIVNYPAGLRMIAGNARNTTIAGVNVGITAWDCLDNAHAQSVYNGIYNLPSIPQNCPEGKFLQLRIKFPQCWDGQNLDSATHGVDPQFPYGGGRFGGPGGHDPGSSTNPGNGHMAYALGWHSNGCPNSHPVALTQVTEHIRFRVPAGGSAGLRLASDMYDESLPGGLSAHADWFMGWDRPTFQKIIDNCINPVRDCGMGLLGDGTHLGR